MKLYAIFINDEEGGLIITDISLNKEILVKEIEETDLSFPKGISLYLGEIELDKYFIYSSEDFKLLEENHIGLIPNPPYREWRKETLN